MVLLSFLANLIDATHVCTSAGTTLQCIFYPAMPEHVFLLQWLCARPGQASSFLISTS